MRILRFLGRAWGKKLVVGNGGLSIRHIPAFRTAAPKLAIFADPRVLESANEDAVWSYYSHRLGLSFAPRETASIFLDLRSDQAFASDRWAGVHGLREDFERANSSLRAST